MIGEGRETRKEISDRAEMTPMLLLTIYFNAFPLGSFPSVLVSLVLVSLWFASSPSKRR